VVAADGELVAIVVETDGETKRVPFDPTLRFAAQDRTAA
jgi:hypothetical protein